MTTDLHKPDPVPQSPAQKLARRDDIEKLISGTLTLTVAPDPTCGYGAFGQNWLCPLGGRCVWESGEINRAWCESGRPPATTCFDSTDYYDPAKCNIECQNNVYNVYCGSAAAPLCGTFAFSDGVLAYGCSISAFTILYDSITSLYPRELDTVVVVDGHQVTGGSMNSNLAITITKLVSATKTSLPIATSVPGSTSSSHRSGTNVGAIVGGIVGGLAVIVIAVIGFMFLRRRRGRRENGSGLDSGSSPQPQFIPNAPDMAQAGHQYDTVPVQSSPAPPYPKSPLVEAASPSSPHATSLLVEAPSPNTVWSHELDNGRTGHHRGSIQEMG
ncbi:uncharacterized protein FOBCDRAFT_314980 [Fusarium oxysporum Fo47]|uniref:Uncharacterized protein n=1 Tax=Fusarium oxysporum Fo47 TaxID=660027 RepID=W9KPC4_FUSOX|nr:uncharacterized protein FOBCDRAFT_314980 [Fusarium oxysporum Fo47]EWZ46241.1 hypothetical protein FOZG_02396 [Fusarium oxysporum Fo47]QKD48628.2 hypothetical protein FOBCDRAFT_314980 [Fusarium oxysporum Fo47]